MLCGSPAGPSMPEASAERVPSARSSPVSIPGSVDTPDDDANTVEDDADGTSNNGRAKQASRKQNLAAILGDSANGSDDEEEAWWVSKRWNLVAILGDKESSKETHPSWRKTKK